MRDTQRGSQSYIEKRRGRRKIEVTRRRKGGIKRGESNLASNSSLCALHSLESSERFTELHREEKREEGDRGDRRRGGEGNGTPTPVFLPGKSNGWRSLVGCSPWCSKESDTTVQLHFHFSLSCIG